MLTGRMSQAVEEARVAKDLEPLSALMVGYLGERLQFAGRFDEAIASYRTSLELDPHSPLTPQLQTFMAEAVMLRGLRKVAAELLPRLGSDSMLALGWAYAVAGHRQEALKTLAYLERLRERGTDVSLASGWIHAGLGDSVRAAELLAKPIQGLLLTAMCDPAIASARRQPPMREAIKHIGLDPQRVCRD